MSFDQQLFLLFHFFHFFQYAGMIEEMIEKEILPDDDEWIGTLE